MVTLGPGAMTTKLSLQVGQITQPSVLNNNLTYKLDYNVKLSNVKSFFNVKV